MAISFDRAADYYDQTRGYPPDLRERVGQAIVDAAGATAGTRFLELGVGTGRIALPIIRRGHLYTGVDISPKMLARLRAALAAIPGAEERVTLIEGDLLNLPFASGSFDVVLTVHVYHLVSDRAAAMAEGLRVLARPGLALNGRDDTLDDELATLRTAWQTILDGLGWQRARPGLGDASHAVADEWRWLGGEVDQIMAAEGEGSWVPAQWVDSIAQRQYSGTWTIPDDLFAQAVEQLRAWAANHFGPALHTPRPAIRRFFIERARFA